MVKKHIRCR